MKVRKETGLPADVLEFTQSFQFGAHLETQVFWGWGRRLGKASHSKVSLCAKVGHGSAWAKADLEWRQGGQGGQGGGQRKRRVWLLEGSE